MAESGGPGAEDEVRARHTRRRNWNKAAVSQ